MTNRELMLRLVLEQKELQTLYGYDESEYEDFTTALHSDNIIVSTVAKIIKELNGETDEAKQKKVYMTIINHINENFLYDN